MFRFVCSKIMSSVVLFCNFIIVLNVEEWIDSTVAVFVGFDPARKIKVRIPRRVRVRVKWESFMFN